MLAPALAMNCFLIAIVVLVSIQTTAIDEVPVSGMRLRDIIKVLQGRSERQRALRVISSHAMNEFTLNASGQPL